MKKLTINRLNFELAFELSDYATTAYLDSESGEVLFVEEDSVSQLDDIFTNEETLESMIATIQARTDMSDYERELLINTARIESNTDDRYLLIPKQDSREGYRDMEDYIESIADTHLQELLAVAIQGSGAFRRFKNVLFDYPEAENNWYKFCELSEQKRISDWFASEEIEPEFVDEVV